MKKTLVILFAFLSFSCRKADMDEKEFRLYVIAEGSQRSVEKVKVIRKDELVFKIKFDSSAVYTTKKEINQYYVNKLYGFSDCGSKHKENSARLGWRWMNNRLELFASCFNESVLCNKFITAVEIGQEYVCRIKATEDNYEFSVDLERITVARGCSASKSVKYYLYPYFGGTETAPKDIRIWIKE